MKCPKCKSTDTGKVSVRSENWKIGAQQCMQCGYQDHWGEFCEPPIRIKMSGPRIILPGIDEEPWTKNKPKS